MSILCSIVLTPPVDPPRLPELTAVAAEACVEAIEATTRLSPRIKLPNDVLVGERKVAGVLAEARDGRVILGMGINVNVGPDDLPAGTDPPATSLLVELCRPVDRAELLVTLLDVLERRYDTWVELSRAGEVP